MGERGIKLSGGQRQRVGIARVFLEDAPIIVFDEATSHLDSESEAAVQNAFWELAKGKTTIVIAHRLSTLRHCDHIFVLDGGKKYRRRNTQGSLTGIELTLSASSGVAENEGDRIRILPLNFIKSVFSEKSICLRKMFTSQETSVR